MEMTNERRIGGMTRPGSLVEQLAAAAEHPGKKERFLDQLFALDDPEQLAKIYKLLRSIICDWAARPVLDDASAMGVETCRKICYLMGWPEGRFLS